MTFSLSQSTSQVDSRTIKIMNIPDNANDFHQWLNAMKMVARLPNGMPPEFRRKLWLAISDRYIIQTRKIDWEREEMKCFSDEYKSDDEELGFFREQIVKDLHRTGSSLCSGPNGTINQAKLKRILLGYTKFNPEVGYCQGFNMLGALILQVMDKKETDSIKVMIYLIEGIIPSGYFCGSLSGLQVDMSVFRELLSSHLPKLARHLQRLQSPSEEEPPLINMFNMQWFLTIFCTCLPMNSVLRVWDLLLIEGSDVLLRTALSIWGLLERKILTTRTADEFYCTMGELSTQLLNGTLIDSNGLVQKIVELGRIRDIQKLRDKHVYNITPLRDKKGITLFYSGDECDSEDEVQKVHNKTQTTSLKNLVENKDRIALDITVLKKQYDKLRERHRQAHIILTAACNPKSNNKSSSSLQINQLLQGKNAIVNNKGRRMGPPKGAVPPRNNKTVKSTKNVKNLKLVATETINRDIDDSQRRRNSIKWKDIKEERRASMIESKPSKKSESTIKRSSSQSSGLDTISEQSTSKRRSESSSYSDETESNSSSTTSLCDEDLPAGLSSLENSPRKRNFDMLESPSMTELEKYESIRMYVENLQFDYEKGITFPEDCERIVGPGENETKTEVEPMVNVTISIPENEESDGVVVSETSNISRKSFPSNLNLLPIDTENIVSTSQLSPIPDISQYISLSTISPLMTPSFMDDTTSSINRSIVSPSDQFDMLTSVSSMNNDSQEIPYLVSDEGVTNEFFERINITDRPTNLDVSSFTNDFVLVNASISNEAQKVSETKLGKTDVKEPKEIIKLDLNDRTRYLREKSFSMDTPNHPITEDLSIRSSSDSKVSNDSNKCKRISRIIEENTAMLDRLKKAFNASESDENFDISVECIAEVSGTLTNIISTTDTNSESKQHNDDQLMKLTQFAEPSTFSLSPKTMSMENILLLSPAMMNSVPDSSETLKHKEISTQAENALEKRIEVKTVQNVEIIEETGYERNKEISNKQNMKKFGFLTKHSTFSATFDQASDKESDDVSTSPKLCENQITDRYCGDNYLNKEPEKLSPSKRYELDLKEPTKIIATTTEEDSDKIGELVSICEILEPNTKSKTEITPLAPHNLYLDQPEVKPISLSTAFELELRRKSLETILDEPASSKFLSKSPLSRTYLDELFPATSLKSSVLIKSTAENRSVEPLLNVETAIMTTTVSPESHRRRMPEQSTSRHSSNTSSPTYPRLNEAPNDITATINSINNSIKSINLLCKRNDDELIFARLDKIINEKPLRYPRDDDLMAKSAPKILIENQQTNDDEFDLNTFRSSRHNQRCISPRRRNKEENKEEYLSRVRRGDVSPSIDTIEHRTTSTNRYSFSEKDEKITHPPPTSSPFLDKLEIRHTTFTSTFYDRFLFDKSSRSDKSPVSPTVPAQITRSYLDSLRATTTVHPGSSSSRVIKSAENSPSRKKSAVTFSLDTSSDPHQSKKLSTYNYSHVKSCENIPLRANATCRLKELPTTDRQPNYKMDKTKIWNFE